MHVFVLTATGARVFIRLRYQNHKEPAHKDSVRLYVVCTDAIGCVAA